MSFIFFLSISPISFDVTRRHAICVRPPAGRFVIFSLDLIFFASLFFTYVNNAIIFAAAAECYFRHFRHFAD